MHVHVKGGAAEPFQNRKDKKATRRRGSRSRRGTGHQRTGRNDSITETARDATAGLIVGRLGGGRDCKPAKGPWLGESKARAAASISVGTE